MALPCILQAVFDHSFCDMDNFLKYLGEFNIF